MDDCSLNSGDLQSLAKAEAKGKLPQLKHLDISFNRNVEISDLFTHSARWNQLTTFVTSDGNVLNLDSDFLTSLEKIIIFVSVDRSITQQWPRLKFIKVWNNDHDDTARCIVDGVERDMFPSLTTVRCTAAVPIPLKLKLFRANISVE